MKIPGRKFPDGAEPAVTAWGDGKRKVIHDKMFVEMNEEKQQLKYGAIISYIAIFINTATALVYIPWMARKLGKSDYGLYTLAFSFVNFFLVDFGLSAAVSRFVAKYRAEHDEQSANKLVGTVTKMYLAIDVLLAIVMVVVYFLIDKIFVGLTPREVETFKPLFLIMAGYSLFSLPFLSLPGILTAYEKFVQLKLCDLAQKLLTVALIIVAIRSGLGVAWVLAANIVGGILCIFAKLYFVRRDTPIRIDWSGHSSALLQSVLAFSVWTTVISIAERSIFNLAPTILGITANSDEIALFAPANSLEGYFYMFAAAVNGLFLARISRYIANREEDRIFSLMVNVGRYQLAVMGLIFIGFLCLGDDFMSLWMGREYHGAALCAILMFVPDLLLFTQQIANDTVIAKNEVKHMAYANIGMAVICVGLSFPLSSRYGALGSSIAIAVSYMFTFVYMNIVYYRRLNIDVFEFFRQCYSSFLVPYGITIVLSFLILPNIEIYGWGGLLTKAFVISAIYFTLIWSLALRDDEKKLITSRISGKSR